MIHIYNPDKAKLAETDKNMSLQTLLRGTVTLALLLMLMPIAAIAGNVNTYVALQADCSASGSGDVVLTAGITDGATQLTIGRSLILDLNGKKRIIIYKIYNL